MPPWAGAVPAVLLVGGLSLLSLWGLVGRSLRPGAILGAEVSLDGWRFVLSDPDFGSAVVLTLRTAILATVISVALAVPLGRALQGASNRLRILLTVPIPVPHLVVAAVVVTWVGPGGLADRLIGVDGLIGSRFGWGVIAVYVAKEVPFLTILVATALDPSIDDLEEAVRGLGGSASDRWRTVILPGIAQPLAVGTAVVAAFVIGATEVPLAVGPLAPDAMTTYGLTLGRVRGPVTRAEQATALMITTVAIALVTVVVLIALRRFRRLR